MTVSNEVERHPLQQVAIDHWEPDEHVLGYLPRITCKACRDARGKLCSEHTRIKCQKCRNNITSAHIDLDYVGHADVNRELTMLDPTWNWEPCGWTDDGTPAIHVRQNKVLVLWGRLTLHGVTRLCVGSCQIDKEDADKELVGDLIRNGAMRHNVYGSLWSKAEGMSYNESDEPEAKSSEATSTATQPPSNGSTNGHAKEPPKIIIMGDTPSTLDDRRAIKALVVDLSETQQLDLRSWCIEHDIAITLSGQVPQATTVEQCVAIRDYIMTMEDPAPDPVDA